MKEAASHSFRINTNVLVVDFYEPDSDHKHHYDIGPLRILGETMIEDNEHSQLIFHLGMKSWASTSLLYDLAAQISKYCPDNKINWKKSFLDIELGKIASRYVDDNYIISHTDPEIVALGGTSSADAMEQVMMELEKRQSIDKEQLKKINIKIIEELRKRGIS